MQIHVIFIRLPGHLGSSSDKKRTWKKRVCSVPQKNITTGDRQKLNLSSGQASHTGCICIFLIVSLKMIFLDEILTYSCAFFLF